MRAADLNANSSPASERHLQASRWRRVTIVFACLQLCCLLLMPVGSELGRTWAHLAFILQSFLAASLYLRASKRGDLPGSLRLSLKWNVTAHSFLILAMICQTVEEFLHPERKTPFFLADIPFLLYVPCALIGLNALPRDPHRRGTSVRSLVDGLVFVVGVGSPLLFFAVLPGLEKHPGIASILVIAWPMAALIGMMAVNLGLLTRLPLPSSAALGYLLVSLGLGWLSDIIFTLIATQSEAPAGIMPWLWASNTLCLAFAGLAACEFLAAPMPPRPERVRSAAYSPVPLLTLLGICIWLSIASQSTALQNNHVTIILCLSALLVVLLLRELIVLRERVRDSILDTQREERARFETLVRHSSDAIVVTDEDSTVRFASPAVMSLFGLSPEQLLGKPFESLLGKAEQPEARQLISALCAAPTSTQTRTWQVQGPQRAERIIEVIGSNPSPQQEQVGLVFNIRDVTERKQLEARLQNAIKMEAVGRMAGGVAHDFNNLLTSILGNAELMQAELPKGSVFGDGLDEIIKAGKHGAVLTQRLLALNKTPAGHVPKPCEVSTSLRAMQPLLQRQLKPHQQLVFELKMDSEAWVSLSEGALCELVSELVLNARDACAASSLSSGLITVRLGKQLLQEPRASRYLSALPGSYCLLQVCDDGIGMEEATLSRLFEPFFTTKPRGEGKGLGLSHVFAIAKSCQAGLEVSTHASKGTTISVWLPLLAEGGRPAPRTSVSAEQDITSLGTEPEKTRILLVDDDDSVRLLTERMLVTQGYRPVTACSADDAEAKLRSLGGTVDLLLTDVMMPGRSGPALACGLSRHNPDLRVLFMSGFTGDELETHGLGEAGDQLLVKPFTYKELEARVKRIMNRPPGLPNDLNQRS